MINDPELLKNLSLGEKLGRVTRLWKSAVDRELAPLDLTYSRWTALWRLRRLGDHISQKILAEALEIELASLMRTLSQLEEQGFIERHCNTQDKRVRIVSLTSSGHDILRTIEAKVIQVRKRMLTQIDENELAQLNHALEKIIHSALEAIDRS
jgi:MarR family transcriptional regulator for hemolysin